MGFIMDGLEAEAYDRNYCRPAVGRRASSATSGPNCAVMLFVAVLVVLSSLMDTAFPILISQGIDIAGHRQNRCKPLCCAGRRHLGRRRASPGSSTSSASGTPRAPWATWSDSCGRTPSLPWWPATCHSMMSSPRARS